MDPADVPVVVGVGQWAERLDDPGYEALAPAALAARAVGRALEDAGVGAGALELDVLACTRQFDESIPGVPARLGRPDVFPRAVARHAGVGARRFVYDLVGGQSPQALVTEMATAIAAGHIRAALVCGSEAISTVLHLSGQPDPRDFGETTDDVPGEVEDRGYGLEGLTSEEQVRHQVLDPPTQYALLEHARRAHLGLSRDETARQMGELFAPFSEVASANPLSAAPRAFTPEQLLDVDDDNRMIVDPYPKRLVSREKVNQGAAVLVLSTREADRLGVPLDRRVHLHGHALLRDRELLTRPELHASRPAVEAVRIALEMAGTSLDDVAALDLYSCFPIAVAAVCDGLGLRADDPRGLTLTGGLPFFGGAGNGYSLHAIAEAVDRCRAHPGDRVLVGANGGMLSKYAVGVYATDPAPWHDAADAPVQSELDAVPDVPTTVGPDGEATVETWTVQFRRDVRRAVVVGRLPDGTRFIANADDRTDEGAALVEHLLGADGPGTAVRVQALDGGNVVSLASR